MAAVSSQFASSSALRATSAEKPISESRATTYRKGGSEWMDEWVG